MRQVCLRKFIYKAVNLIDTYNIKTACIENFWKGYSILQKHTFGKTSEQRNKQQQKTVSLDPIQNRTVELKLNISTHPILKHLKNEL